MEVTQPIATPAVEPAVAVAGRPTRELPLVHLLNLSVYWLGINAIWAGLGYVIYQARFIASHGETFAPTWVAVLETVPLLLAILVQPTIAAISDYTVTRWGRRKPYILIGSVLDVVFLWGIASSNEVLAILAFVVLLQCSSNFAQGPFQGYVPDLVPQKQVGTASGLMGVMIILGQVAGVAIATIGLSQLGANPFPDGTAAAGEFARQVFFWPTIGLAVIEVVTMIPILLFVDEGRHAPLREGRTWVQIALGAWGLDILKQRSYVWLLISRLFFLMAPSVLLFVGFFYLMRTLHLPLVDPYGGLTVGGALTIITAVFGGVTGLATLPAARLSDRYGRKRMIYAAIVIGSVGMLGVALAPNFPVMVASLVLVGISSGSFLAVDWALMTDIIPKATSGRYMGISNVATAISGPIARVTAGVLLTVLVVFGLPAGLDMTGNAEQSAFYEVGPRVAMALTLLFFAISALTLRRVDETRRED